MKLLIALILTLTLVSACTKSDTMYVGVDPITDVAGSYELEPPSQLPLAKPTQVVELIDGGEYTLTAEKVRKELAGRTITMYGYNGMIPGPIYAAKKGTSATITFQNNLDKDTAVHWHGLRGDYTADGTPGLGQDVIRPGESFVYKLVFPDEGIFWYHPHVREDAQQDLGLHGNVFVSGLSAIAGTPDVEKYLVIDDIALTETGVVPFGKDDATHAVMGRYGNVLLVNGEPEYTTQAKTGEVVRFYITNVANARPFMIQLPGARIKLVGGDNGAYLEQRFTESLIIGPAERYVIDVLFDNPGTYELRADNPLAKHLLGTVSVTEGSETEAAKAYDLLRVNKGLQNDIDRLQPFIDGSAARLLELDFSMRGMRGMGGMNMMEGKAHDGIEWEDTMTEMSSVTSDRVDWIIRDAATGKENDDITINAKVGDIEKWSITNKADSMHPMQHPIHLHGQRFLVTKIDGVPTNDLVWKDVVLVPIGHTVEIVVEYTNAGEWMLHCHIAEHLEAGMFAYVSVADETGKTFPRIGEKMH